MNTKRLLLNISWSFPSVTLTILTNSSYDIFPSTINKRGKTFPVGSTTTATLPLPSYRTYPASSLQHGLVRTYIRTYVYVCALKQPDLQLTRPNRQRSKHFLLCSCSDSGSCISPSRSYHVRIYVHMSYLQNWLEVYSGKVCTIHTPHWRTAKAVWQGYCRGTT